MKNRLLLLLLPAAAGLTLWAAVALDQTGSLLLISLIVLPLTLGFAVQGAALLLSRQRLKWLRFASLALLLIPAAGVVHEASLKGMFWGLAAVIWAAAGVLYLTGWGAAWALEAKRHE